ncbi:MAG: hypothetical protein GY929_04270, partial [Actinomycetia bacterium]|nr:hypothetical protein [Actinomycetes bacterium]
SVLSAHTGHRCVHFHIGGDQVVPDLEQLVEIRRFAFNDLERPHPFHSPVHCVETFTSSGEERVIDYRRAESGVVEPVVGPAVVAIDTGHRRALWSAARATATLLPSRAELSQWGGGRIEPGLELVEATRAVLTLMWEHPEPADAESLRTLGFETDEVGASIAPLARPYRLIELVTSAEGIPRSWRQGSIELTPRWLRAVLRRAVRLKGS